jgi:hypothetical protein
MTHQGLRFRLLWLLVGMVSALRVLAKREREARLAQPPAQRPAA